MSIIFFTIIVAMPVVIYGSLGLLIGNTSFVRMLLTVSVAFWIVAVVLDLLLWGGTLWEKQ